ncbi:MAG: nucleotidyltransferase family protein [Armatimonadetes bacterium]|nr:nucleotidyltransferase family protein [Armatimonadota bacterium]
MRVLRPLEDLVPLAEERLLVEAVGVVAGGLSDLPAASSASDWERVAELARAHRVGAVVAHALARTDCRVPSSASELLGGVAREEFAATLISRGQLGAITAALSDASVPAMLLKGAALDQVAYPADLPRTMSDLDLLVPEDRLPEAVTVARSLGYRDLEESADPRDAYHVTLACEGRIVELHWRITARGPFRFPPERIWMRRLDAPAVSPGVVTPCLVDLFVLGAFHYVFQNRFYNGLQSLLDLALLAGRAAEQETGEELVATARETNSSGAVYWAMCMLHDWLGMDVGDGTRKLRPAGFVHNRAAQLLEETFADALSHMGGRPGSATGLDRVLWRLACTSSESPVTALSAVATEVFRAPRGGEGGQRLTTPLSRALFLLRPSRWWKAWRALRGDRRV